MRITHVFCIGIVTILCFYPSVSFSTASTTWSSDIKEGKSYHWKAKKSELRDLESNETYDHGVGGINVPGGDNEISLKSLPSQEFDFIGGDRLNVSITVEGDMGIYDHREENPQSQYYIEFQYLTDWCLLILPIEVNGTNFFELLFREEELLENLTQAAFISSEISESKAQAQFEYNKIHELIYEWDLNTGFLKRKEVTAPSGKQLLVVPGEGSGFNAGPIHGIGIISFVFSIITIGGILKKKKNY